MATSASHTKRKLLFVPLTAGGVVFGLIVLFNWLSVSPLGAKWMLFPSVIWAFILLGCLPLGFIALIGCVSKRLRRGSLLRLATVFAVFTSIILGLNVSRFIREHTFDQLTKRSRPLTQAIEEYVAVKGKPPAQLSDLVPAYISEVPTTGIGTYPDYELILPSEGSYYEPYPWVLRVQYSAGFMSFEEAVYAPSHTGPKPEFWHVLRQQGNWYYLYD
jgi:hypothetical protein